MKFKVRKLNKGEMVAKVAILIGAAVINIYSWIDLGFWVYHKFVGKLVTITDCSTGETYSQWLKFGLWPDAVIAILMIIATALLLMIGIDQIIE